MNIIIMGPPGAGKGTMSRLIQDHYNIPIISTGEILREEIKKGTELGKAVQSLIDKGNFVPDGIVIDMINNSMTKLKNGFLLDGFPRNISQAVEFDKILVNSNYKIDIVININVSDEMIIDRVKKRLICPKCSCAYHTDYNKPIKEGYCDFCNVQLERRKDDNEEYVKNRLEIYHRDTKPLIDYYDNKGILAAVTCTVNDIDITFEKIKNLLDEVYIR